MTLFNRCGQPVSLILTLLAVSAAQAAPGISFDLSRLDYGNQLVGQRRDSQTVRITNVGTTLLTINSISFTGANPGDFVLGVDSGQPNLAPGVTRTVEVYCRPLALGPRTAALAVSDNATGSPHLISLSCIGVSTYLDRSPRSLDFGTIQPGETSAPQTITMRNDSNGNLRIEDISTGYTDQAGWYRIDRSGCPYGTVLSPGGTCTIAVSFQPKQSGSHNATLYVSDSAPSSPHLVSLTGAGAVQQAPVAPSNLSVQLLPKGSINPFRLTWTDNSGDEKGFEVYYWTVGGPYPDGLLYVPANATSIDLGQGFQRLRTYGFKIRAYNATRVSEWSNEVTKEYLYPTDPPAAPTGLTAVALSIPQVQLTWTDNSSNERAFAIWRKGPGSDFSRIAVVSPNTTSFLDRSVNPLSTYTYRVRATNNYGASAFTNDASATTPDGPPAAPTGLTADLTSPYYRVRLSWIDNSNNETQFAVFRKDSSGVWTRIAVTQPNSVGLGDSSAASKTTYTYRVRAANNLGVSAWSNEVTVTTR